MANSTFYHDKCSILQCYFQQYFSSDIPWVTNLFKYYSVNQLRRQRIQSFDCSLIIKGCKICSRSITSECIVSQKIYNSFNFKYWILEHHFTASKISALCVIIFCSYMLTLASVLQSNQIWFINFYSPFCSHCHDLAPTVSIAAPIVPKQYDVFKKLKIQ